MNDFQPNFFQALSDNDVNRLSSQKRVKKSITRNLEFLNETLEKTDRSKSIPFATIEAAWFLVDPLEGHKILAQYLEKQDSLGGFVINGIKDFNQKDLQDEKIINEILAKLPENKPKYFSGDFNFEEILGLALKGADLFDSSFVTRMTDEAKAFVLPLDEFLPNVNVGIINESLPTLNDTKDNLEAKEFKHEELYYLDLNNTRLESFS